MNNTIIQITAGRGPEECCRVVARVAELLSEEAGRAGVLLQVLDQKKGPQPGTYTSVTLQAQGNIDKTFRESWSGTVQWIAESPYRKGHKRRNWFAGVSFFSPEKPMAWNEQEVRLQTCKASGPGGQHVNKVETAVRGIHLPSGIQVLAADSRSQLQNRKLCLERLKEKVRAWQTGQRTAQQQEQWQAHQALERGRPVRVIKTAL